MKPTNSEAREPGRSFDMPNRPLGAELLARTPSSGSSPDLSEGPGGLAERAQAISVMRKAEELMASNNPPPAEARRAFELAAGRVGLSMHEYDALVKGDAELEVLEQKVLADFGVRESFQRYRLDANAPK